LYVDNFRCAIIVKYSILDLEKGQLRTLEGEYVVLTRKRAM